MPFELRCFPVRPLPRPPGVEAVIQFDDGFLDNRPPDGTHHAIDIVGTEGLHVVSTTDGHVVRRWHLPGQDGGRDLPGVADREYRKSGFFVVVVDPGGHFHHYAHLQPVLLVRPGQRVVAGQQLGWLGQTGNARGNPHLHYQVRAPLPDPTGRAYADPVLRGQGRSAVNPYDQLVAQGARLGMRQVGRSTQYRVRFPAAGRPAVGPARLL
jgi:murein DD-endopeptidase MepM/ murein hydrolase activator NlpD